LNFWKAHHIILIINKLQATHQSTHHCINIQKHRCPICSFYWTWVWWIWYYKNDFFKSYNLFFLW